MLSHEEMVGLHAEKHNLIDTQNFPSKEAYVLHLTHLAAYAQASRLAGNKKVLDVGCNTGYGSEILLRSAKDVVGVDVSEKAVSAANRQHGHLGLTFQVIDGKCLPFEDNEFDMIVSCQVIEHIVDYDTYISELQRVLSTQGMAVFTTPNALLRLDTGMKPWNEFHVREFNYRELESLLGQFFPAVRVFGLFAEEPLYSIEVNRLRRNREYARKRNKRETAPRWRCSLRSLAKTLVPQPVVTRLREISKPTASEVSVCDQDFMDAHGIDDFVYRAKDMEIALDLMAVCSNHEDGLREIQNELTR